MGRPVRFLLAADQSRDILAASALIEGMRPQAVMADHAYEAAALRQAIASLAAEAVVLSTHSKKTPIPHDSNLYRLRIQ